MKRVLGPVKPTRPESLILEAWSQGFVVGALIIMSAITIANMRKRVLLHKLILLEVRAGLYPGDCRLTTDLGLVIPRDVACHLHLLERADVRMVPLLYSHSTQYILELAQCHCMDEDEAFPYETMESVLHRNG